MTIFKPFLARFLLPACALGVMLPLFLGRADSSDITPAQLADLVRQAKPKSPGAWTRIPWVDSLVTARAISRKEQRPVFLFALLGDLACNRC